MASQKHSVSAQTDKENITTRPSGKESNISKLVTRNPLSSLCDNVILPYNGACKQTHRKTITSCINEEAKSRSHSVSEIEEKIKHCIESKYVTKRSNDNKNEGEVFVEGKLHYVNFATNTKSSAYLQDTKFEITQPLPVVRNSLSAVLEGDEKKPAQKVTLMKKLSRRYSRPVSGIIELCTYHMYDIDYFSENFRHLASRELEFVFRKQYLLKFIDKQQRPSVVSWLSYIQQVLEISESALFAAVRMLDKFLILINVPSKKYALVGIASIWIASKVFDSTIILVPKLFALCSGKFSRQQIISMEKQILKILKFQVNFSEPSIFLYFYMRKANLESEEKIWFGAMFLLEIFTLLPEFSSSLPSLLACAALYLILLKYNMNYDSFLKYVDSQLIDEQTFKRFASQMGILVKEMLKCKVLTTEIIAKYSVQGRFKVAQDFFSE